MTTPPVIDPMHRPAGPIGMASIAPLLWPARLHQMVLGSPDVAALAPDRHLQPAGNLKQPERQGDGTDLGGLFEPGIGGRRTLVLEIPTPGQSGEGKLRDTIPVMPAKACPREGVGRAPSGAAEPIFRAEAPLDARPTPSRGQAFAAMTDKIGA